MKFIATCKIGLEALVTRQLHDLGLGSRGDGGCARFLLRRRGGDGKIALVAAHRGARAARGGTSLTRRRLTSCLKRQKPHAGNSFLKPETNIHVTGKIGKEHALFRQRLPEHRKKGHRRKSQNRLPYAGDSGRRAGGHRRSRHSAKTMCRSALTAAARGFRAGDIAPIM